MNPSVAPQSFAQGLRLQVFLARLIWLCILPLVLLAIYLAAENVLTEQKERDLDAANLTRTFVSSIDQQLNARIGALGILAHSPLLDNPALHPAFYQEALGFYEHFGSHVILADIQMQMLLNTRVPLGSKLPKLPRPQGYAAAPVALQSGKPAVGDSFLGPIAKVPLVAIAAPAVRNGQVTFLLLTIFETSQFQRHLNDVPLPAGWALTLQDSSGKTIAQRVPANWTPAQRQSARHFVAASTQAPWSVTLEIPQQTYRAPQIKAIFTLILIILGATLVGVTGGLLASRRLKKSIESLTDISSDGARPPEIAEIAAARRLIEEGVQRRAGAEAALRDSEQRFRDTFEQAAVGISHLAPDGRWLWVNRKLCEMLGYHKEELQGRYFQDLTRPGDLAVDLAQMQKMLAGEIDTFSCEKCYIHKNGSLIWCALSVTLTRKQDGSPDYFIAVIKDIRDRKQAENALQEAQAAALRDQQEARLAALALMDDAVTARDHAEAASQALQKSEAQYRLLAENSADCIFWIGVEGEYRYISPACASLTGYGPEAFLADPALLEALIVADDRPSYRQHLANREHVDIHEQEFRITHQDGSIRWIGHRCQPIRDEQGQYLGRTGAIRDITEQKQAEAELYLFSEALRQSAQPILLSDQDARITYLNPAFTRLFGYQLSDLQGETVARMVPDASALQAQSHIFSEVREKGYWSGEAERLSRDGQRIPLLLNVGLIHNAQGKHLGYVGNFLDLRPIQEKDAMLRKLSLAVEQSPESIIITNTRSIIEYVNEAFVRNTGFSRAEVYGKTPRILQSGHTPPEIYADMWQTLVRGESWKGELRNHRKDGSEYIDFAAITPIRQADGHISHYVAVQEDITEKKRLGEELEQHRHHLEELVVNRTAELNAARAEADAANQAKSAFLANMSHEIRTPMNAIIGLTYLMRHNHPSPTQRERLDKIDASAQHLLSIINDILDFSKIEAGRMLLEQVDFSLDAELDHVHSLIAEQARGKGLRIEINRGDAPPWLHGDATRVRQAILNYVSNAIKFTEHGAISVRTCVQEENEQGVLIRFEVQDTGMGIPADKLPMLFDSFAQADVSITRRYGGTGLGLAITRRLARMMDGDAGVSSTPNEGSTFWFTARLRRCAAVIGKQGLGESAEAILRKKHAAAYILLVEDNPINCEIALELLRAEGLTVDTADNGLIALEKIRDTAYDLVLMDMQMPVMDGLSATRAIRALPDRADLPILAMTANAFDNDRHACLAAGMNDFVAKPVEPEELYTALLRWLPNLDAKTAASTDDPAMPDAGAIAAQLAGIPDLDVAQGLACTTGNIAKYRHYLQRFAMTHADDMAKIDAALGCGDMSQAQLLAHTLKGLAATLGCKAIATAFGQFEQALQQKTGVGPDLRQHCATVLQSLIQAIRSLPQSPPASTTPRRSLSLEAQMQALSELAALLAANNTRANDLARACADLLREILGSSYADFMHRIEIFDYEWALAVLRKQYAIPGGASFLANP